MAIKATITSPSARPELAALGRTIVAARSLRDMTRNSLADAANISYTYLAELENGLKSAGPTVLLRIATALGTDTAALLAAAEAGTVPGGGPVGVVADGFLTGDNAVDAILLAAKAVLLAGGSVTLTP